jgi:hypothetical protein
MKASVLIGIALTWLAVPAELNAQEVQLRHVWLKTVQGCHFSLLNAVLGESEQGEHTFKWVPKNKVPCAPGKAIEGAGKILTDGDTESPLQATFVGGYLEGTFDVDGSGKPEKYHNGCPESMAVECPPKTPPPASVARPAAKKP